MYSFITQHNATDVTSFEGVCNCHADSKEFKRRVFIWKIIFCNNVEVFVVTFSQLNINTLNIYLSWISQAHSPPNHNALLHLSINHTHLHVISTLISQHSKAHTSHQLIVRSRFVRSGLILLQLVTCSLYLDYLLHFCLISSVFFPALLHRLFSPGSLRVCVCLQRPGKWGVCSVPPVHEFLWNKKERLSSPSSYYCACSLNLLLTSISFPLTPPITIKLNCCILTTSLSLIP